MQALLSAFLVFSLFASARKGVAPYLMGQRIDIILWVVNVERMGGNWIGWGGFLPDIEQPFGLSVPRCDTVTNARIKRYLIKDVLQVANEDIFPTGDFERRGWEKKRKRAYDVSVPGEAADPERSLEESKRRARAKIRDIALCNKFSFFFTWTIDGDVLDRYSPEEIYPKLRGFLSNMTQRKGFEYVLVPEYHAKKENEERPAIHFHGLCNVGDVRLGSAFYPDTDIRMYDAHSRPIFNMLDWKYGFSTCIPLDSSNEAYEKTVNYVSKYITKSSEKIFGKWYLSSRSLRKSPDVIPLDRIDFDVFRDEQKIQSKAQYECNAYFDVRIVSEDYEREEV